jgi:hypothetical protein
VVALYIAPLPEHLKARRVDAGGAGRAKGDVCAARFEDGCGRSIGVEGMSILRMLDVKELDVADYLAVFSIDADCKEPLPVW